MHTYALPAEPHKQVGLEEGRPGHRQGVCLPASGALTEGVRPIAYQFITPPQEGATAAAARQLATGVQLQQYPSPLPVGISSLVKSSPMTYTKKWEFEKQYLPPLRANDTRC